MSETVTVTVNGNPVMVPAGSMVSAAIGMGGVLLFRRSVMGEARGPLCGMGICFECRVTINGQTHMRSCQTLCEPGMEVRTGE
jgi:predicted molibdopterin-dependent oxidoreductase YjgC